MKYYRIANKDADILTETSLHQPGDIEDFLWNSGLPEEKIEDLVYYADEEEQIEALSETLAHGLFYDADGHEGEGLYFDGVCCLDDKDAVLEYFENRAGIPDDSAIFEFEGRYITDCEDGDVVKPTRLISMIEV